MTYEERLKFITDLGWVKVGDWDNRTFYELPCARGTIGRLIEHQGVWSIPYKKDNSFIWNPSDKVLEDYTNILKKIAECIDSSFNPSNWPLITIALSEATRAAKYTLR